MVSTVPINGNIFLCFSFFRRHTREESPGCTCAIEYNYDIENGIIHFARIGLNKRPNHNRGCKILLIYDPQSSTSQSPAGEVSGPVSVIGNQIDTLNCAQT